MSPEQDDIDKRDGREPTPRERTPRDTHDPHDSRNRQSRSESAVSREFAKAVGRTIKVIRTDRGIERRDLAETVGISYSYLTEIENGNKPASSTVLRPIAHALGLRLSQLTEAAEIRLESQANGTPGATVLHSLPPRLSNPSGGPASSRDSLDYTRLSSLEPSVMRPSLRGQHRELRDAILELERLLERMAPDDIERLLDYARRLSR